MKKGIAIGMVLTLIFIAVFSTIRKAVVGHYAEVAATKTQLAMMEGRTAELEKELGTLRQASTENAGCYSTTPDLAGKVLNSLKIRDEKYMLVDIGHRVLLVQLSRYEDLLPSNSVIVATAGGPIRKLNN